jgi:predicted nucleic acid-binding protein
MLICIDSNQFIFGLTGADSDSSKLLDGLTEFSVAVPRIIVQEVTRNLDTAVQVRKFYQLLYGASNVVVIDEPVPRELVAKYEELGLPDKADAVIGAFVEWVGASYLLSENRHFRHTGIALTRAFGGG